MAKTNIKEWIKEHKKQLIFAGATIVVVGVGIVMVKKGKKSVKVKLKALPEDFGLFKFEDTATFKAVNGEIEPITELFEDTASAIDVTASGHTLEEMGELGAKLIETYNMDPKKRTWVMVEQAK